MSTLVKPLILITMLLVISAGIVVCSKRKVSKPMFNVENMQDVLDLFPKSAINIENLAELYIDQAKKQIQSIISIANDQRTFENTAKALDNVNGLSDLAIFDNIVQSVEMTNPDATIRKAAHNALIKMQDFSVDYISNNVDLYKAFKAYVHGNAQKEQLTENQWYYLNKTMDNFKRNGLDLAPEKLELVKKLNKELATLELNFGTNINEDNRVIKVTLPELAGLDDDFIKNLKRTDDGLYILSVDYPTYQNVMENCSVSTTRQKHMIAMENRAYPVNKDVLLQIIAKRDELAKLLGFRSYADLDLSNQMVGSVDRAEKFIAELLIKAKEKEKQEFVQLTTDLADGVQLNAEGKIHPWDFAYAKNYFKKKHYNVDEQVIAEYFPMEKTIKGLLDIYQTFFALRFEEVAVHDAWHQDVSMVKTYDAKTNQLIGYLFLDLYPRENKYTHACHITLIPATYHDDKAVSGVSLVIANFPKSTATKPSLLKRKDVSTFFHEFGHALHALLGRTQMATLAGTHVKRDFVELPSQMLEEWLNDKEILKQVSGHYITGRPLPDDVIEKILELKNFSSGAFLTTQLMYSKMSLDYFKEGEHKDPYAIMKKLYAQCRYNVEFMPEDHKYASFGHLTGYGAKYYGYMWSKVFALDIFDEIKRHGLLNPLEGQKYVATVLSKGGSKDPNQLLRDFLGREPNQDAFLKDLGLMS